MPDRIIKADYWTDETISGLDIVGRLLYIGIWTVADDQGVLVASPKELHNKVLPGHPDVDIKPHIQALIDADKLVPFESGGKRYWWVPRLLLHQRKSYYTLKHPSPPPAVVEAVLGPDGSKAYQDVFARAQVRNQSQIQRVTSSRANHKRSRSDADADAEVDAEVEDAMQASRAGRAAALFIKLVPKPTRKGRAELDDWVIDHGEEAVCFAISEAIEAGATRPYGFVRSVLKRISTGLPKPNGKVAAPSDPPMDYASSADLINWED